MNICFEGKRVLVTGAGKGIGRALVLKLSELDAEVVAISRTQKDLDRLSKINSRISTICLDIGNWDLTKDAIQKLDPIDLLVNNAGILESKAYGEIAESEVTRTFDINVKAMINITQIVVEKMKSDGRGGSIVNISSLFSTMASPGYGTYCASRGAVDQLTRSMAVEFGPHNIRVNAVKPTATRTPQAERVGMFDPDNDHAKHWLARTPLGRFCEVEEIVYPILFLLSDKASMITGITLPIDGGLTVSF